MVRCLTSSRSSLLALVATFVLAGPAAGLSVTPDPLVFANLPIFGATLDFAGMTTGLPAGGVVLDGAVGGSDVSLLFTLSVDASTIGGAPNLLLDSFGSSTSTAAGTVAGSGEDVVSAILGAGAASWTFEPVDGVALGETSDVFFLSFSSLPIGTSFLAQISALNLGNITVVPEAGTALLVLTALGAGWLGSQRRRP